MRPGNIARQPFGLRIALICVVCVASSIVGPVGLAQSPEIAPRWSFTGSLNTNRYEHTATLLPNGKVLVVGGGGFPCVGNFCYSTVNGSAEVYDPLTGFWSYTGDLNRRTGHSATLLQNGQVLVVGGSNYGYDIGKFSYVNTAEAYDPTTGKWRRAGDFNSTYTGHSATLLQGGKVLVVGAQPETRICEAQLYDPISERWNSTSAPANAGRLTLLANGKVLVVSGNSAELYDPSLGTWSSTRNLNAIRLAATVTLLRSGKVLATGTGENDIAKAELFDPETETWNSTGNPLAVRGTATVLADGRVLLAGGYDPRRSVTGEEIYDPDTGVWSFTSHLITARSGHTATLLPDGKVLVTGGVDGDFDEGTIFHSSAELYGPIAIARIVSASVSGKHLIIVGENFDPGAKILLNGDEQPTRTDSQNPKTTLIGKKVGKKIKPGDKLQVRNPNGSVSAEFSFTGL